MKADEQDSVQVLCRRLARLFWDRSLQASDIVDYPVWIVERVLEYGDLEDVQALMGYWGREPFLGHVAGAVLTSARTRRFWENMLRLEGLECTRTFSRPTAWPC